MKSHFQYKKINFLNRVFIKFRKSKKYADYNIKKSFQGLLEWDESIENFCKIEMVKSINLENLFFIENQKKVLIENTRYFLEGGSANNALLWGSRGTGKSSLVLAIYSFFKTKYNFVMIEVKFFQIKYLPKILRDLENTKKKIIIYCDDFSFDSNNESFIVFKNTLEGSLRKHNNIIFYVTSNYRHLVRNIENNNLHQANDKDNSENQISLSDRFGIWLGFHNFNQEKFLKVVFFYAGLLKLNLEKETIKARAVEWALLRGSYSGREAINLAKFLKSETF